MKADELRLFQVYLGRVIGDGEVSGWGGQNPKVRSKEVSQPMLGASSPVKRMLPSCYSKFRRVSADGKTGFTAGRGHTGRHAM